MASRHGDLLERMEVPLIKPLPNPSVPSIFLLPNLFICIISHKDPAVESPRCFLENLLSDFF